MKYIYAYLIFSAWIYSSAQDIPPILQQQLEDQATARDAEQSEDDNLLQHLEYHKKHPLDVNLASVEELASFHILNELQLHHFIQYRKSLGSLVDLYELQSVPLFDLNTIFRLLPYVRVGSETSVNKKLLSQLKKGNHEMLLRWSTIIERLRGYRKDIPTHFLGDRNHLFLRYRYQFSNRLMFGILGEKDPGEQFFKGAQSHGFDFYSAHIFFRSAGLVKSLALGDFSVNLGQGLVLWQSLAFGKGLQIVNSKRQSPELLPYRSAGEFNFMRGAGITFGSGASTLTAFVSKKKISANISDTAEAFSGFLASGMHRTESEIIDRNAVGFLTAGCSYHYQRKGNKIGMNSVIYQFSRPIQKRELPYNLFAPSGQVFPFTSIDYSATIKNLHLFGELASDLKGNYAFTSGFYLALDQKVDLAFHYRHIAQDYFAFMGNAFTENTFPTNEQGTYLGIILRPVKGVQVNASTDMFRFPWLKYRIDAPSYGKEYLFSVEYQASRKASINLLYKWKETSLNSRGENTSFPELRRKQWMRLHAAQQLSKIFQLRCRIEWIRWIEESNPEEGVMFFLEGILKKTFWQTSIRLQFFESGGYNSRIYAFENDVRYSNSMVAVFDKGFRYYLNFKFAAMANLDIYLRWSQSIFRDKEFLGSGLSQIEGNRRSDLRVQFLRSF